MQPCSSCGLLALALWSVAVAERCEVSTVVVHCEARCDGINATSYSTTAPLSEQLLPPSNAVELLAELEGESGGAAFSKHAGGRPLVMMQLQESWFWGNRQKEVYAPQHEMLSPDQLIELVGPLDKLEWRSIRGSSLGCVDGRHSTSGLYAYGGDFGELLLALTVYEHMVQRKLSQTETTAYFSEWLKKVDADGGSFAMCTNAATISQLATAVGTTVLDLSMPSEELRPSLLLRLIAPEFVGSEHVKWMLQNPDAYTVRRALVEQLLRSFYGALWNEYHPFRRRLKLDVFTGSHAERAVARLHTGRWCTSEQGLAPALATRSRLGSLFIYTPDAVTARRADLVSFFSTRASPPVDAFEMRSRVSSLGDGQAQLTEKAMTGMLRSYTMLVK